VVVTASDLCDVLALEAKFAGNKSAHGGSRHDTASKLILLTSSPCKDFAFVI
jgi:hypothetical protein